MIELDITELRRLMAADENFVWTHKANVMAPDGKSVLGMVMPAEYEDKRSRWVVRCYLNGVKAHLMHDETGQLLVFSEATAVAIAQRGEAAGYVRYEAEQQP